MKLQAPVPGSRRSRSAAHAGGFTLPEVLTATTVFLILVSGIVFANLFGLSMFRITEAKLNATEGARRTIERMANEIRTCKTTWVGNVTNGVFAARLDGETQQGNGLMIQPTTNAANYIVYFVNPSDKTFRRTTSTPGNAVVIAGPVTNTVVFRAQNYSGTVLTNNQNNRVIHFNLEFYQPKRHMQVADYYKLETAITRRAVE